MTTATGPADARNDAYDHTKTARAGNPFMQALSLSRNGTLSKQDLVSAAITRSNEMVNCLSN